MVSALPEHPRVGRPAERLPSLAKVAKLQKSVQDARAYNKAISPEDQEAFYRAGINKIAERIWQLASLTHPNTAELRIYLDLFMKHLELEIKNKKTLLTERQIEIYEKRLKQAEEATKDSSLSAAQYRETMRTIFDLSPNGYGPPKQIENGFAT